ncbi:hypothetical protein FQN54_005755 [Arachnomyces sp. PD_36]|nr:hypothetical protein FQN54_005755 [Arachnomyces sp. PD_36]
MTLEDFEKSLAESKKEEERHERSRDKDRTKDRSKHRHHRSHHHRESSPRRHRSSRHDDEERHRHKRSRHSNDNGKDSRSDPDRKRRRHHSKERKESREKTSPPPEVKIQGEPERLHRDSWMEAPSALDIDYVQRRSSHQEQEQPSRMLQQDFGMKLHDNELNRHLHDLEEEKSVDEQVADDSLADREVDYKFGDSGSKWRMTRLRAVYRQAEETGKPVEEIAIERFGDLRSFDDVREEEVELDRRERYGQDYVGKEKPNGELFQERKLQEGVRRNKGEEGRNVESDQKEVRNQGQPMHTEAPPETTKPLDSSALNRLKAQMMKAKLRGSSDAAELEAQYTAAAASFANKKESDVVVLGVMDNRMLAGGNRGEVKPVDNKRGRERGQVEQNEDMTVEDMVQEERRNRGQAGEGQRFAERIAKDAKFDNDLEYMDDNAAKLAKRVQKSELNIKNTAINEFQKMNKILDNCPLCHHEDSGTPPVAPVVSLATRVYLTLPTEPELSEGSATLVPIQHRSNLVECDDDEWEEIRNFMKSLTRMYHDQGRDVIFYENAAQPHRKRHATMEVVPLPYSLGETSPAFFKEAILAADEEWTQHKKLIDTLSKSRQGMGKLAFRRMIVKEMPYFHVWFELDGGLGHVVEDANRWPRGDLFAREVIGGMLDLDPSVVKKQGKWTRGVDRRVEGFRKRWKKFDWTRILTEE